MSDLLTVEEVAERLRVTARTVRTWCTDGELPYVRLPKGGIRVRVEDLELMLEPTLPFPE